MSNIKIFTFSNSNDFENTAQKVAKAAISNIKSEEEIRIKVPEPKSPFWYRDDDLLYRVKQIISTINPKVYIELCKWFRTSEYCFEVWKDFDAFVDFSDCKENQLILCINQYNQYKEKRKHKFFKVPSIENALKKALDYKEKGNSLNNSDKNYPHYSLDFELNKIKGGKLEILDLENIRINNEYPITGFYDFMDMLEYWEEIQYPADDNEED